VIEPARMAEIADALAPLGPVAIRRMFGGAGVYCEGRMFGLLAGADLYARIDPASEARFEAAHCAAFVPEMNGRSVQMPYRRLPDAAQAPGEAMREWMELGLAAATRVAAAKARKPLRRRAKAA
jgi:DNA transformation protein